MKIPLGGGKQNKRNNEMEGIVVCVSTCGLLYGCFKAYYPEPREDDEEALQAGGAAAAAPLRWWLWRGMVAVALLVFAGIAARSIVVLSVRKMQTGSMWLQEYEWYGLEASGARNFPHLAPRNRSVECLPPHLLAPAPHAQGLRHTIDPALLPSQRGRKSGSTEEEEEEKRDVVVVHVVNKEQDLFGFMWNSLLEEEEEEEAAKEESKGSPERRSFPALGLELVLVQPPEALLELEEETVRNVLVVGSFFEPTFIRRLPKQTVVGGVMLGGEMCRTAMPPEGIPERLRFSFFTYGDCTLVDNKRFFLWPLGPSIFHGFPPSIAESKLLPADHRSVFLNLLATISERKPTRMQAAMAADEVCRHLVCLLEQTNFWFKAAELLDSTIFSHRTNLRELFASQEYLRQLMDSKLTLCPSGNTPEQYRIWEALMAGSIPVLEDPPFVQGRSLHPASGDSFGCMPDDIHRFFKVRALPSHASHPSPLCLSHCLSVIGNRRSGFLRPRLETRSSPNNRGGKGYTCACREATQTHCMVPRLSKTPAGHSAGSNSQEYDVAFLDGEMLHSIF